MTDGTTRDDERVDADQDRSEDVVRVEDVRGEDPVSEGPVNEEQGSEEPSAAPVRARGSVAVYAVAPPVVNTRVPLIEDRRMIEPPPAALRWGTAKWIVR